MSWGNQFVNHPQVRTALSGDKRLAPAKQDEHLQQKSFFGWVRDMEPTYPALFFMFAAPNGGKRPKAAAGKMNAEGQKAGVPDIWFPLPHGSYAGLVIEMKTKTGSTSLSQKAWLAMLREVGFKVEVCRSEEEAIFETEKYIKLPARYDAGEIGMLATEERERMTIEALKRGRK